MTLCALTQPSKQKSTQAAGRRQTQGPAVRLHRLSLAFGGQPLFQPVTLTLAAGQLHMLTGANGAGKSSLLKCIAGLMPHQGDIVWHWPDQGPLSDLSGVGKVAYIPQLEAFDATLPITVEDYLLASIQPRVFFRRPAKPARQRLEDLLRQVGLEQKHQRKIGQLSGGERQRLLFARALAQQATLWFLDEPMNGLDREAQEQICQLILRLRAEGCTLVMVHHDPGFVQAHADQEIRMSHGQVLLNPDRIKAHPVAARADQPLKASGEPYKVLAPDLQKQGIKKQSIKKVVH